MELIGGDSHGHSYEGGVDRNDSRMEKFRNMARFLLVLRWILQGSGEDCGVVSDCEELVVTSDGSSRQKLD